MVSESSLVNASLLAEAALVARRLTNDSKKKEAQPDDEEENGQNEKEEEEEHFLSSKQPSQQNGDTLNESDAQPTTQHVELQRELGLFSAVSLEIDNMIGSGIFVSPSTALQNTGSVGLSLVIWAVCGLISLLGALSFSELSTVVPRSGAEYSYFRVAFSKLHPFLGPLPCFLYAWVVVLILRPAEVAIIILTFTEYVYSPVVTLSGFKIAPTYMIILKKLLSLLTLGTISYINFSSVKLFVKLQNVFSSFKIVACFVVILGGVYSLSAGNVSNLNTGFQGSKTSLKDIVLALYSGLWAYDGWSSVTVVAEEIKNPEKNIFRSILIGVPLVTILYFFMNVSYMSVLTIPEMMSASAVAESFGEKVMGNLSIIIPIGVALSTFSCSLSVQFGVSRLCYAAGREGHMIEAFSYIHVRKCTPASAVAVQGLLTTIFILAGDISKLIEFASFLIWIFYGLTMVALIVLCYKKPLANRPYKVPILIPISLLILSVVLAAVPIVFNPQIQYICALIFILLGLCVYYPFVYLKYRLPFMDKLTYLTQVMLEVVPPPSKPDDVTPSQTTMTPQPSTVSANCSAPTSFHGISTNSSAPVSFHGISANGSAPTSFHGISISGSAPTSFLGITPAPINVQQSVSSTNIVATELSNGTIITSSSNALIHPPIASQQSIAVESDESLNNNR
ncbi:hypothetical protein LSTR_LSTR010961 [Laodelphax striatellus]|uniref:b(0,+)-type amino acid transporter 1 n=1 Tax=Laodelphax striatellus TaxID=195883 RepID=A0A482WKV0_LAOST|nr:hypothetical protein LSTR_LSTR010961 [Laodelphax striatellus]